MPARRAARLSTPFVASRRLLDMAGVKYRQYVPQREKIVLDFTLS